MDRPDKSTPNAKHACPAHPITGLFHVHILGNDMVDISKCGNVQCPLRMNCYRFTAISCQWRQSYISTAPVLNDDGEYVCDSQWKLHGDADGNK